MFLFADNQSVWNDMFAGGDAFFWAGKVLRPMLVYFSLVLLLRIFTKRELGQLNPIDLVVILSLSNTVQNAIIGEDNSVIGGIVGAMSLLSINYAVAYLKFKSPKFETFIEGSSVTLINDGKIDKKAVERELMTEEDLNVVAHEQGFDSYNDLKKCVLDPNGTFLVEGIEESNDDKFKKAVLDKLDELSRQMAELKAHKS